MNDFKPDFRQLEKVLWRQGEPDRVPLFELYIDPEIITTITGKPLSYESRVEFFCKMGYDHATIGITPGYTKKIVRATDTAQLSRGSREFPDENQGAIMNRKDFDAYPWPKVDRSIAVPANEMTKLLPDGMKLIVSHADGILENAMWLMGYIPFSYALHDDEQLVWDLFERIGNDYIEAIRICLEESDVSKIGGIDLSDDMGFNQGTMIAPELLRKFVLPWHKKAAEVVHSFNLPVIMHSCGNLESIMDDLIDVVGIDVKHSYEDKIMPVTEAKKRYGKRIAILGGVDIHVLCTADEARIREYVDNVMESCAPGGGFAIGSGNSIPNYMPVKNYLTMLDEGRRRGTRK